jgi:hypothetical protein
LMAFYVSECEASNHWVCCSHCRENVSIMCILTFRNEIPKVLYICDSTSAIHIEYKFAVNAEVQKRR